MSKKYTTTTPLDVAVAGWADETPRQIANRLARMNIVGRPGTTTRCPLATAMSRMFPGRFLVGKEWIMRRTNATTPIEKVPTPANIKEFIENFDLCKYGALIAPPPKVLGHKAPPQNTNPNRKKRIVKRRPSFEVSR